MKLFVTIKITILNMNITPDTEYNIIYIKSICDRPSLWYIFNISWFIFIITSQLSLRILNKNDVYYFTLSVIKCVIIFCVE